MSLACKSYHVPFSAELSTIPFTRFTPVSKNTFIVRVGGVRQATLDANDWTAYICGKNTGTCLTM